MFLLRPDSETARAGRDREDVNYVRWTHNLAARLMVVHAQQHSTLRSCL